MSVKIKFECDGCQATADGKRSARRHFESFDGKGWGFGVWKHDQIFDLTPDDWIAFDPYTGCCYCPKCWAEIEATSADQA